jgi:hypothetical protein
MSTNAPMARPNSADINTAKARDHYEADVDRVVHIEPIGAATANAMAGSNDRLGGNTAHSLTARVAAGVRRFRPFVKPKLNR